MTKITQKELLDLINYNPETGICTWKERIDDKIFNKRFANKELSSNTGSGYLKVNIYTKQYQLHRIIWLYMTGEWPIQVDHINGIRDDNKWENLRNVSHAQNGKNQKRRSTNTSGITGVYKSRTKGKWRAIIYDNMTEINLGTFSTIEKAATARKEAEILYNYHENHGRDLI